ncbi:hypothetical protein [Salinisphaera aquimarina]|uniref:Thioesterase domain-containing protein n=1 Tax=Salinisphaera aquimarina TaxID=2094031 RepID=A0ABV7EMP2_9GAMM
MSASYRIAGWVDDRGGMPKEGDLAADRPGPGSVLLSVNCKFAKPVYVGDTIGVCDDNPACTVRMTVEKQTGKVCVSGEAAICTTSLPQ